jgi:hypothetical protein
MAWCNWRIFDNEVWMFDDRRAEESTGMSIAVKTAITATTTTASTIVSPEERFIVHSLQ